jgi:hypothetical protein
LQFAEEDVTMWKTRAKATSLTPMSNEPCAQAFAARRQSIQNVGEISYANIADVF